MEINPCILEVVPISKGTFDDRKSAEQALDNLQSLVGQTPIHKSIGNEYPCRVSATFKCNGPNDCLRDKIASTELINLVDDNELCKKTNS